MYIKSDFANSTLQNEDKLHFIRKKFGHIKKKYYLCTRFQNKPNRERFTQSRLNKINK